MRVNYGPPGCGARSARTKLYNPLKINFPVHTVSKRGQKIFYMAVFTTPGNKCFKWKAI